ncbi:MAG: biotin/lipoyl-binding protein [Hyphomicrobiaceae bacterium]
MSTLFQQSATDTASSPERLDQRLKIVPLRLWVIFAGLVLIITAALFWGFFGSISARSTGIGMLRSYGVSDYEVTSKAPGIIKAVFVKVGDKVKPGDRLILIEHLNHDGAHADGLILSSVAGEVEDIDVLTGSPIDRSHNLMTIRPEGFHQLEVMTFISAEQGNRVLPGMTAQIFPRGVDRNRFGGIRGQVLSVSHKPVSRRHVEEHLHNKELASTFFAAGAPLEVLIAPELNKDTASGFAWTTHHGPPFPVEVGTLADVAVILDVSSPISLVLPQI